MGKRIIWKFRKEQQGWNKKKKKDISPRKPARLAGVVKHEHQKQGWEGKDAQITDFAPQEHGW